MHEVVVIGAGSAGIRMAVALKRAGRHDFVVLECVDDTGPGCALAEKHGVAPHLLAGAEVTATVHDEASGSWRVTTADGAEHRTRAVVMAVGAAALGAVVGRDGVPLQDVWRDGAEAHRGITVAGFPNLFWLAGPSAGHSRGAPSSVIERRIGHVGQALDLLDIATRGEVPRVSYGDLRSHLRRAVWRIGGCDSWYGDRGRCWIRWPVSAWGRRDRSRDLRADDLHGRPRQ